VTLAFTACVTVAAALQAQGVVERTPNLDNGWTVRPGVVQFNFLHRFTSSDAPARKVTSFPTFVFATGLPAEMAFGVRYATNSTIFPGVPNEYELWLRRAFARQARGAPLDVSLGAAYNNAAESVDGELALSRAVGPLRLLAAVRGMSSGYDTDRSLWGAGGGAIVRVTPWLSLAGDVFQIVSDERGEDFRTAWGAGAQIAIPYTPHTFSLQVVNTNTASIQGASRGSGPDFTVGFEFTIPITLARYFGPRAAPAGGASPADSAAARGQEPVRDGGAAKARAALGSAEVRIANLAFGPAEVRVPAGTRVRWVNGDALQHTVSADDGGFESGLLDPGGSFERTFGDPGTFAYHCTPHPFMRGMVVVE
jgi:plastocyanin